MTTHIMVDLETWGTAPGCDIRSIGAVVFDPAAGTLGDEFYVNVENRYWDDGGYCASGSWMKHPLTRDPSTVEWWSKQSDAAQQRLTTDVVDLKDGLVAFSNWWNLQEGQTEPATFWAHGPHFDEAILAACYRATELSVPWHYRAPRDCRTVFDLAGDPCHVTFEGVEHDALADAKNQALRVIEAYRRIRAPRDLLREAGELFRMYERSHEAKLIGETDPSAMDSIVAKVKRNSDMAARIEGILA